MPNPFLTLLIILCAIVSVNGDNNITTTLPNDYFLSLGYDAFIGQPLSSMEYPIFNTFTYNNNQTTSIESTLFLIPDITTCIDYPSETEKTVTEIYTSELLLQQSMYKVYSYSFDPWYSVGMLSGSKESEYFHQQYQENARYTASTSLEYTVYKIWYNSKNTLNPVFQKTLESLPTIYNNDTCPIFKYFFNMYGTHFVFQAIYGGGVIGQTSFDVTLLESLTIEDIHEDIQTQFILSTQEYLDYYQMQKLSQLNAVYSSVFMLVGGNPSLYNVTEYQAWTSTILSDPVIIGMELKNYTYFLNDTNQVTALNQAMTSYFYSQYIGWKNINTAPYNIVKSLGNFIQINNNAYFFSYTPFYRYNLIANLWYDITSGPYNTNYISYSCTGSGVSANIYCFGGFNLENDQTVSSANSYNPETNAWSVIANMPQAMDTIITASVPNYPYIYIFGGVTSSSNNNCDNWWNAGSNYIYDTSTNTYATTTPTPQCLVAFDTQIVINDIIYLFAPVECQMSCTEINHDCDCGNIATNTFWSFNTQDASWTQLAAMPVYLTSFATYSIDNIIYTIGGYVNGSPTTSIYAYDIVNNVWSLVTNDSYATQLAGYSATYEKLVYFFGCNISSQDCSVQMNALEKYC